MVLAVSSQGVVDARSGVSGRYLVEVLEFKVGEVYEGNRRVDELPPTALLRVAEPDTGESGVFLVDPGHPAEAGGLQISMGGRGEVVGISIFSYKTDPGSSVVYLGTILLTLASLLALWVGYEEVRVRVQEGRSEWRLTRRGLQLRLQERLERIIAGPARPQPPRPWDGAV